MQNFDKNNQRDELESYNNDSNRYSMDMDDDQFNQYRNVMQGASNHEVKQLSQEYFEQMPETQRMGLFSGLMGALGQRGAQQAGVRTTDPSKASPGDLSNLFGLAVNSGLLDNFLGKRQQQPQQQPGYQQPQQQSQGGGGLGDLLSNFLGGDNNRQPDYDDRQPQSNNQQPQYGNQQPGYSAQQPTQQAQAGAGLQDLLRNPMAQAALSGLIAFGASRIMERVGNQGNQQPTQQPQQPQQQAQANWPEPTQQPQRSNQPNPQGVYDLGGGGSALPGFENEPRQS